MHTIKWQLQQVLNNLSKWSSENGFKFSKTKTKCMHFCQSKKLHLDPELTLDGVQTEVVPEFKCLGLLFDSKLTFILHINYLSNKYQKALNLVSSMDWGADRKVLLRLYTCPFQVRLQLCRIWLSTTIVPSEVGFYPQPRFAISAWRFQDISRQ